MKKFYLSPDEKYAIAIDYRSGEPILGEPILSDAIFEIVALASGGWHRCDKVTVYAGCKYGEPGVVEVNWSAHGSVSAEAAFEYAGLIELAAKLATALEQHLAGPDVIVMVGDSALRCPAFKMAWTRAESAYVDELCA